MNKLFVPQTAFTTTLRKFPETSSRDHQKIRRSNSRIPLWIISLLFLLSLFDMTRGLRLNYDGGYEDVTVAISSDVPPIACQQLIQNLQGIFASASDYLHEATHQMLYFHRVVIVLPPNWDARACGKLLPAQPTSASSTANAAFRIGTEHPVFGHSPFTQQSQGCRKPGDFISFGYQYAMQYNESGHGTSKPDRAFVHEWAKFRYGVFEEKGYENDPIYPMAYHEDSRDDQKKPTSCTNRPLKGNWSESCRNDGSGSNCLFSPSTVGNDNVSSSIMSFPHLPQVKKFCDHSTHNPIAPTKHNFLCGSKSVMDILLSHPDFIFIKNVTSGSGSRTGSNRGTTPEFIIKQLIQPRFVLLVEETGNMNLRDVWKYLKLAIRKFIKYDLPTGTQIGLVTIASDIRTLANMTSLDENLRGTLAEKLPNYPNIETNNGGLSLRKGITHAINMLKGNGQHRVAGSVIILISQGTISQMDLETSLHLLKSEEVSIATIEYPSIGDGKISTLSQGTQSPHYSIRESGVGSMSHMSTYIQLVNAMMDIQRFYTKGISTKWPTLIHQEEFKGDSPKYVESSFSFDASQFPGEFYIYIPTPIDPKVNKVELTSPTGVKFTDQLSYLHDINVIKIDASINQPGIWRYRIERLGDSHQSHYVQVLSSGGSSSVEDLSVRLFSNVEESRVVNLNHGPLILFAEVRRGNSPVLGAEVVALINAKWSVSLLDSGNGDPDLTKGDGIYSRYIIPPSSFPMTNFDITVKVTTSPYGTRYVSPIYKSSIGSSSSSPACCGSEILPGGIPSSYLKPMPYNERIVSSYMIKVTNAQPPGTYPPSRIGDLRIISSVDKAVTIGFTSPGDDYDQGLPARYLLGYGTSRKHAANFREYLTQTFQAGTYVNHTITLPTYGWHFLTIIALDRFERRGETSNIVEVRTFPPPSEQNQNDDNTFLPQSGGNSGKSGDEDKLSKAQIGFIVGGGVLLIILLVALGICCYCRRKGGKAMGSTETKISTISDTKAPIHWSASELLQEHEKRQSIYGQSQQSHQHSQTYTNYYDQQNNGGGVGLQGQGMPHSQSGGQAGHPHHLVNLTGSPGSSTRSFRSISETNRKTSLGDYESCSSDKTLKSAKGQTDYDTCVDSDPDLNYRTIESYAVLPPYRNSVVVSNTTHLPPHFPPQRIPNNNSHMQYNPNLQGSLTSVNSKRRNITMV